jgi:restriction endonuclease S subunit
MNNNGELPSGWKWVKLEEVCNKIGDIDHKMPKQASSGYPYVSTKDFTDDLKISFDNAKFISKNDYLNLSRKIKPEKGDIIFPRYGTIGKNILVNFDKEFLVSYSCAIVKPNPDLVLSEFVYLYSLSPQITQEIRKYTVETTQANIGIASIKIFVFPLPPLDEQQRIVAKIEELFSELDAGVQSLKIALAQLKTYRQAVLKWAFEGKLTNENLSDDELPAGWQWVKLGDICKTIDGDRGRNYPKKNEFSEEGYCLFLSTKNVREGRFVFEENIFITKQKDEVLRGGKLELNDVVITTRGTLGNVALYDDRVPFKHIRINSGMLILRITNPFLDNFYLMKFITSPAFTSQLKDKQTGTAQPQIPANILREIEIPYCSLEEQQRIVQEIESRLSVCDKLEETIAASLRQAEALRQSILKKAFEGKLVASDESKETIAPVEFTEPSQKDVSQKKQQMNLFL